MADDRLLLEDQQTSVKPSPAPASDADVEKTEVAAPFPPPRRRGTIQVRLTYGGRRKPIPVDFPDDSAADQGAE